MGITSAPSSVKINYLQKYVTGRKIIDIGCGKGWYATFLARKGFEVWAIDKKKMFSDERVMFREYKITGSLPYPDNTFDMAIAFDIMEHIEDDVRFLCEIRRIIKRRLILSVPNRDDNNLQKYNLTYIHHVDKTHIREYTIEGLKNLVEKNGYKVVRISLEGPVSYQVITEFIRWKFLKFFVWKGLGAARRLGMIVNKKLYSDIFLVADKI